MTDPAPPSGHVPPSVIRARDGRMVAGVCAGLPRIMGLDTGGLRIAFCLAALCGGIGIVVYAACWLILPDSAQEDGSDGVRGIVLLAWVAGGLVGALLLAGAGALAAVLGLGWVVLGVAAVIFVVGTLPGLRLPPLVPLLAVAALALPATAVALSPVRIALQLGASVRRPATATQVRTTVFRNGLGTLLIDLRHTRLPSAGTVPLHIEGGLRRTIVALPSDRCVRVAIHYDVQTFAAHFATLLSGRRFPPFREVVLFNRVYGAGMMTDARGTAVSRGPGTGPELVIDFSSLGGGLFVRDYPDEVSPQASPEWPGYPVGLEPRPQTGGEPRRLARDEDRAWRGRLAVDRRERRIYDESVPGPCARP